MEFRTGVLAHLVVMTMVLSTSSRGARADDGLVSQLPSKDKFSLFLLMGQSNMVGRGRMLKNVPPDGRLLRFNKDLKWDLAQNPLHQNHPKNDRIGPGMSFGRAMMYVFGQDVTIGLVPCAVGGSSLSRWEKDGGDCYASTIKRARAAGQYGTLTGVLWHQGERDCGDERSANTYAARLDRMIADLRADLQTPDLPFVAGGLLDSIRELPRDRQRPYVDTVQSALRSLPERVPYTAWVDASTFRHIGDFVHIDPRDQLKFGVYYAEQMRQLLGFDEVAPLQIGFPWFRHKDEYEPPEIDAALPNVYVIGGSNTQMIQAALRKRLKGKANLLRPPANCRSTRQTLRWLDAYLSHYGDLKWSVIWFNSTLHDLAHFSKGKTASPPEGKPAVSIEDYDRNMREIVARLRKTGARLLWSSTAPVGKKREQLGYQFNADAADYNKVAAKIMAEENIPAVDIYGLLEGDGDAFTRDGVHLNARGHAIVAPIIVSNILALLDKAQAGVDAK